MLKGTKSVKGSLLRSVPREGKGGKSRRLSVLSTANDYFVAERARQKLVFNLTHEHTDGDANLNKIEELFATADQNNDGVLTEKEFVLCLQSFGVDLLTPEEITTLFAVNAGEEDGVVQREEFMLMFRRMHGEKNHTIDALTESLTKAAARDKELKKRIKRLGWDKRRNCERTKADLIAMLDVIYSHSLRDAELKRGVENDGTIDATEALIEGKQAMFQRCTNKAFAYFDTLDSELFQSATHKLWTELNPTGRMNGSLYTEFFSRANIMLSYKAISKESKPVDVAVTAMQNAVYDWDIDRQGKGLLDFLAFATALIVTCRRWLGDVHAGEITPTIKDLHTAMFELDPLIANRNLKGRATQQKAERMLHQQVTNQWQLFQLAKAENHWKGTTASAFAVLKLQSNFRRRSVVHSQTAAVPSAEVMAEATRGGAKTVGKVSRPSSTRFNPGKPGGLRFFPTPTILTNQRTDAPATRRTDAPATDKAAGSAGAQSTSIYAITPTKLKNQPTNVNTTEPVKKRKRQLKEGSRKRDLENEHDLEGW
jgi:hypothetical protein